MDYWTEKSGLSILCGSPQTGGGEEKPGKMALVTARRLLLRLDRRWNIESNSFSSASLSS